MGEPVTIKVLEHTFARDRDGFVRFTAPIQYRYTCSRCGIGVYAAGPLYDEQVDYTKPARWHLDSGLGHVGKPLTETCKGENTDG